LVRQRRMIHGVVFDVQLPDAEMRGEPIAADQRREPGIEPGSRLVDDGQQLRVSPKIFRTPLDLLARESYRAVVVHRLERSEASIAHIQRLRRKRGLAQVTLQSSQRGHTASANSKSEV